MKNEIYTFLRVGWDTFSSKSSWTPKSQLLSFWCSTQPLAHTRTDWYKMPHYGGEVVGSTNQCLCLPKADLSTKNSGWVFGVQLHLLQKSILANAEKSVDLSAFFTSKGTFLMKSKGAFLSHCFILYTHLWQINSETRPIISIEAW